MKKNNPEPTGPALARRRTASRAASGGPAAAPGKREAAPRPFSADELRRISARITTEWFRPVETRCLTLLEIDPWRVHAYWNIAESDLAAARASLPGGRDAALVLRFADLSPGAAAHESFDIEVRGASNNWYVDLWRDARRYAAELGLRAADGAFVGLARANELETPRGGPSPELDFRQLEVRSPSPAQAGVPAGQAASVADLSGILLRDLFPKRLPLDEGFPLAIAEPSGAPLDEPAFPVLAPDEDVDAAAAGPTPSPAGGDACPGSGADFPRIEAAEIETYRELARQARVRLLAGLPSDLPPVAPEAVAPGGVELTARPLPIPPPDRTVGGRPGEAGSDAGLVSSDPPHDQVSTASSSAPEVRLDALLAGAVFSPGRGGLPGWVSADLVIRGRGEPGSRLLLFGERLAVDADGGFTLRLPLRHGPELAALLRRLRERDGDRGDD